MTRVRGHLPLRETSLEDVVATSGPLWRCPPSLYSRHNRKRYVLMGVSGTRIDPGSASGVISGARPMSTHWTILDSADCFREIAYFDPHGRSAGLNQRKAQQMCDELNAEDRRQRRAQA